MFLEFNCSHRVRTWRWVLPGIWVHIFAHCAPYSCIANKSISSSSWDQDPGVHQMKGKQNLDLMVNNYSDEVPPDHRFLQYAFTIAPLVLFNYRIKNRPVPLCGCSATGVPQPTLPQTTDGRWWVRAPAGWRDKVFMGCRRTEYTVQTIYSTLYRLYTGYMQCSVIQ